MANTRFPNRTSSKEEDKRMETSVIAAPASAPAPAPVSLQRQISDLLDRLKSSPQGSPEYTTAAREFDRLVWGV